MKLFLALVSCVVFFVAVQSAAVAEDSVCPVSDKEFLHQITSSSNWTDVHVVFKRNFPACQDEGLYADGYTNMVVGILAANWLEIGVLDELMAREDAFGKFVLRHIGTSAGEDDLRKVLHSAQASCPKNTARLCKEIATRCKRALGVKK